MSSESIKRASLERDPQQLEHLIEGQLDQLPGDLRNSWQKRFDSLPDDQLANFAEELGIFVNTRERALIGTAPDMFSGMRHLVTEQAAVERTLEIVREAEGNPELYVGEGKTAHVYRDPYSPGICYKYVHDFREYENWNSVDREARYLEELEGLAVDGVRVPTLSGVIDLPDAKVIGMELIDAPSMDKFLMGRRKLAPDFDVKLFFKKLKAYVEAMHARGIYHRDLHEGNVLIGADSTPYIIDFGRATFSPSRELAYEAYDRTGLNRIMLTTDEDWIYTLEVKMADYLAKQRLLAK